MDNVSRAKGKGHQKIMSTSVSEAESERRLRPAMDALREQNHKQALKILHQALQKRPGWPAARALRACVFVQTGRWKDAELEIITLRGDLDAGFVPLDEDAAQKILMYYQKLRQESCAAEVYEQLWCLKATEVRFAETAFCLYIRGYAFQDAQKLATKLHRLASARTQKYGFWATAALWLGVMFTTRDQEKNVALDSRMLKLACAMMGKSLAACTTPTAEIVRFASRIYKQAGQMENARELVSNPRLVMDEAEVLHIKADLTSEEDHDVSNSCKVLLHHDPDDWKHWVQYFKAVRKDDLWVAEASDFIDKVESTLLVAKQSRRGPFLARMELFCLDQNAEKLADTAKEYFAVFGSKNVCAHDLRPYLCILAEKTSVDIFFAEAAKIVEQKGAAFHVTLSWLQLWFDRLEESPGDLFQRYTAVLSDSLEPTDRQLGDDYLIMAAHKLLPIDQSRGLNRYRNAKAVLECIAILETGLCKSPFNFHFKLLLIRLYVAVGGMERVFEIWDSLNIKHVQLATLTHLVLRPFFETGHHFPLLAVLKDIRALWQEVDVVIPECISKAFQAGSVNAAIEFVLFKLRLEKSAILAYSFMTEGQIELVFSAHQSLGIGDALDFLTAMPRFTEETISATQIINNNDSKCFHFWDIDKFDPDVRINQADADLEEGEPLSPDEKMNLGADLASLTSLLQTAAQSTDGDDCFDREPSEGVDGWLANGKHGLSQLSRLRRDISSNLSALKDILCMQTLQNTKTEDSVADASHAEELSRMSTEIIARLVAEIEQALNQEGATEAESHTMKPNSLRMCGVITYDLLVVTSVAVCSLGQHLVKGRRKAKKAAFPGVEDFEHARNAILGYRESLLTACLLIQQWVTTCLEHDKDWVGAWAPGGDGICELVPYLPQFLHPVDLESGEKRDGEKVSRVDFCNEISSTIQESHSTSCSTLLKTLASITSRLKLADF